MPVVELVILSVVSNIISNVISNVSSSGISSYINKPNKLSSLLEICEKGSILRSNLSMIDGWLKDVELNKPRRNLDEVCVREIELVAYDARDAIDQLSWLLKKLNAAEHFTSPSISKSCEYILPLPDLGRKIDSINNSIGRIHEMKKNLTDLILEEGSGMVGQSDTQRSENCKEIIPTNEAEEVVGFDNQVEEIKAKLIDKQHEQLGILSIVGIGGIGKSTLAMKIFNDSKVEEYFPMRIWIGISEQYYNVQIKSNNNDQIRSEDADQNMTGERIIAMLIEYLKGGRCLIVIDGIWAAKLWKAITDLKSILSNINNGSRIIQTTRKLDVARFPSELGIETDVYEVKLLDENKSWELLEKKAFQSNAMTSETTRNKLEKLRKKLTKKCNGLPLALIALGDYISSKLADVTWSIKTRDINWGELAKDGINISQSLTLSYNDLPPHLKPLFLYMTSFPAGEFIKVSELIKLWIAEEFIQPNEEKARDFVEKLQERCLFKEVKRSKARGWITRIMIHRVLCDWGKEIAKKEKFFSVIKHPYHENAAEGSYRVALHGYCVDDLPDPMSNLRSLLGFRLPAKEITSRSLNSPRVVTFNPEGFINKLPQGVKQMIFLRYICLRKFNNINLPPIEQLYSLQTLDCRESTINSLSDSLWKISHLRHVYLKDVCCNWNGPRKGSCKNLRSLYIYDRSPKKSKRFDRFVSFMYTGLNGIADAVEEMAGIVALRLISHAGSLPQNILNKISPLKYLEVLELREEALRMGEQGYRPSLLSINFQKTC
jgi:NB-ARC domain